MLFGVWLKNILGDRDTYAGRKSIHHRTKNGARKFQTPPFAVYFKYKKNLINSRHPHVA